MAFTFIKLGSKFSHGCTVTLYGLLECDDFLSGRQVPMSGRNLLPPTYGRLEGGGNRFMRIIFGVTAKM